MKRSNGYKKAYPFDKPLSLKDRKSLFKKKWKDKVSKKSMSVTMQNIKKTHQKKQRQHNNLLCKEINEKFG